MSFRESLNKRKYLFFKLDNQIYVCSILFENEPFLCFFHCAVFQKITRYF